MKVKPLLPMQPVTQKGDRPSPDLVEVIQRLERAVSALQGQVEALEAQVADHETRITALETP